jgi:hypothetical protein
MGDHLPLLDLGTNLTVNKTVLGRDTTCVLFSNGKLKCFGTKYSGMLGGMSQTNLGDDPNELGDNLPFWDFGVDLRISDVSLGSRHGCVVLNSSMVKCW